MFVQVEPSRMAHKQQEQAWIISMLLPVSTHLARHLLFNHRCDTVHRRIAESVVRELGQLAQEPLEVEGEQVPPEQAQVIMDASWHRRTIWTTCPVSIRSHWRVIEGSWQVAPDSTSTKPAMLDVIPSEDSSELPSFSLPPNRQEHSLLPYAGLQMYYGMDRFEFELQCVSLS